ncbi:DUF6243 family protein [Streptomyces sp. NBC_00878]|uniref:DUF6243 family protein n=1 Tax=Streptomyces sp. NBC_00878 TaxID=2975854 RepID=UPI00225C0BCE|nr:DUF6243 family protein [Streptomyces sp. NBC_00878]MCX4909234.1 DUF6243 family protein [Streptomyces sp. NBC_00878]
MLGVGGTRSNLGRKALRGGGRGKPVGAGLDPQAQKRELLRKLQESRTARENATQADSTREDATRENATREETALDARDAREDPTGETS